MERCQTPFHFCDSFSTPPPMVAFPAWARRRSSRRREGSIRVDEPDRIVILTDRIPDDGLRQLVEGGAPTSGYLWNEEQQRWNQY
jgi:hypothetical protein